MRIIDPESTKNDSHLLSKDMMFDTCNTQKLKDEFSFGSAFWDLQNAGEQVLYIFINTVTWAQKLTLRNIATHEANWIKSENITADGIIYTCCDIKTRF